jgi:hypothetical protein
MKFLSTLPNLLLGIALAGMSLVSPPPPPAHALCAAILRDGGFEGQKSPSVGGSWISEGRTGIDIDENLSYAGKNNAWLRHNKGWNGIRQSVRLQKGETYKLKAMVRTSENVTDGYIGFRDQNQRPVSEIKFGATTGYQMLEVTFRPNRTDNYNVFVGIHALGQDTWAQIDNVRLDFPCDDVILNPG